MGLRALGPGSLTGSQGFTLRRSPSFPPGGCLGLGSAPAACLIPDLRRVTKRATKARSASLAWPAGTLCRGHCAWRACPASGVDPSTTPASLRSFSPVLREATIQIPSPGRCWAWTPRQALATSVL